MLKAVPYEYCTSLSVRGLNLPVHTPYAHTITITPSCAICLLELQTQDICVITTMISPDEKEREKRTKKTAPPSAQTGQSQGASSFGSSAFSRFDQ